VAIAFALLILVATAVISRLAFPLSHMGAVMFIGIPLIVRSPQRWYTWTLLTFSVILSLSTVL
jgi:hypothetical protein